MLIAVRVQILLTGGSGFLGKNIARRLLDRGDRVRVVCRTGSPELVDWGCEVVLGDVADLGVLSRAARGCDAFVHAAARVGAWGRYEDFYRTNVQGTKNAISVCQNEGIGKLVFTSTPSVVHRGGDIEGVDEAIPYAVRFDSHYAKTKSIAEQLILSANNSQLATVALRPHLIWGPGDTQLLPRFEARYRAGRLRLAKGPTKLIDTVYIENAVDAHLLALGCLAPRAACAGRAYFITNGEPLPISDVVNGVLATRGLGPVKKHISPWTAHWAGALAEGIYRLLRIRDEPPITRFVARQLTTSHWFSIDAARRDLGYNPKVNFAQGLKQLQAASELS